MLGAEPLGELDDHLVVGAAARRRLDQLRPELQELMRAGRYRGRRAP